MTTNGYLSVKLANMVLEAKLDSGSDLNLISQAMFDKLPIRFQNRLKQKTEKAVVADQHVTFTKGTLYLPVLVERQFFKVKFTLFPDSSCPVFLGRPFLQAARAKVDHGSHKIQLSNAIPIHSTSAFHIDPHSQVICQARLQVDTPDDTIGECSYVPTINTKGIMMSHTVGRTVNNLVPVRLYNSNNYPIQIKSNERFGSFTPYRDTDMCIPFDEHKQSLDSLPKLNSVNSDPTATKPDIEFDLSSSNLSEEQNSKLLQLLQGLAHAFVDPKTKKIGLTNLVSAKIETYPNAVPISKYPYRMAPALREELQKIVLEQERLGIIEPTSSGAWSSPALLVPKSNGSMRMVIDYRGLNAVTIPQVLRIPRLDDVLDAVGETKPKYFSVLDLTQGFHQIPLDEESRDKTAFLIPGTNGVSSKWRYRTLPQGLSNSPATFQNLMDLVLRGVQFRFVMSYIDDIIIYSSTFEQHLDHLKQVLDRIVKAGLKLSPSKCKFAVSEVDFLGHRLHSEGVSPNANKLEAVRTYPQPNTVKKVRAFLGLTGFYRRFIPKYAEIARPLYDLTKKDHAFVWDDDCEKAFQNLKNALTSDAILVFPDFTQKFVLATDASDIGIGACLSQEHDGILKPIGYAGRAFNKAERNYTTTDKELLAVVFGVQYFKVYLQGVEFDIHTDHSALKQILTSKNLEGRRARWVGFLQEYKFKPYHIKGKDNVIPDALSRRHYDVTSTEVDEVIEQYPDLFTIHAKSNVTINSPSEAVINSQGTSPSANQGPYPTPQVTMPDCNTIVTQDPDSMPSQETQTDAITPHLDNSPPHAAISSQHDLHSDTPLISILSKPAIKARKDKLHPHLSESATTLLSELDMSASRIITAQRKDPGVNQMIRYLTQGELPTNNNDARHLILHQEDYIMLNDILYHIHVPQSQKSTKAVAQLVIPQDLKAYILNLHHDTKLAGHVGIQRVTSVIKARYYWQGMLKDIHDYVSTCKVCSQSKPANRSIDLPLTIRDPAPSAFHTLIIDTVGPLVRTPRNNKHIVVVTDLYSRYVIAWPTPDITAKTIAAQFYHKVICVYGAPKRLLSDNGSSFVGAIFKELCTQFEIKQSFSTAYHPQSQGGVERANRTIINALRNFVNSKQTDWDTFISPLTFAMNASDNSPLGYSAYMLVFGRAPTLPSEINLDEPYNSDITVQDQLSNVLQTQAECHEYAMTHLKCEQDKMKKRYDQNDPQSPLKVGSIVYVYQPRLRVRNTKKKLQKSFHGPFMIIKFNGPKAVILRRISDGKILDKSISIQRLKLGNIRPKQNNWDQGNYQVRDVGIPLDIEDIPDDSLTDIDPNHTDTPPTPNIAPQNTNGNKQKTKPRRQKLSVSNTLATGPPVTRVSKRANKGHIERNRDFVY